MVKNKEEILKLIEEGYSLKKISEILKENYRKILEQKDELMQEGLLTDEDIRRGKDNKKLRELQTNPIIQGILKYKRQGISDSAISKMPNIKMSQTDVSKYVKECIRFGLITEKEIEEARNKKEKKDKDENTDRKIILEGLKLGKTHTEIAKDTTVGYQQVKNIKLQLIEEGLITQEEIDIARENAEKIKAQEKENKIRISEEIIIDEEKLLSYLILGYDTKAIEEKMQIYDIKKFKKAVGKLIDEQLITEQEIKEYQERKAKDDKEKVLEGLKKGMSQREIAKIIDTSLGRTQTYIKNIMKEEEISEDDILHWKEEKDTSIEKRKAVVLEGLKEGLSRIEIAEKYPKQELKTTDVKKCRNILIEEGIITEEEIKKYRELKKQKEMEKEHELTENEKRVLRYLKRGYKAVEIAELMEKSICYIYVMISKIKKSGEITKEEIDEAREKRKVEELKKIKEKEKRERIKKLERLRNEISIEVRLGRKASNEKKEKIRNYIELCFEIHEEEKISKLELLFLKEAIKRIPTDEKDIIRFVKHCISIGEYEEAFNIVANRHEIKELTISKQKEESFKKLEVTLDRASKIKQAIQIIKRGNANIEVISDVTGLSKEEVGILQIKVLRKPIKILNIPQREQAINALKKRDPDILQEELGITDFEMEDIKDQFKYRRVKEKLDFETQIKQDSKIRIMVLFTKLGKSPENIAKMFKTESSTVEKCLESALKAGLVKKNELKGINPLESAIPNFEELEL